MARRRVSSRSSVPAVLLCVAAARLVAETAFVVGRRSSPVQLASVPSKASASQQTEGWNPFPDEEEASLDILEEEVGGALTASKKEEEPGDVKPNRAEDQRWTVLKEQRWLPPKGLNGRRWYMDDANTAIRPDEHNDEARMELNRNHASPLSSRINGGAATLLRQYTDLDRPGKDGVVPRLLPFEEGDFAINPDRALDVPTMTVDLKSMARVQNMTEEEVEATGLTRDMLRWVYSLPRPHLRQELYNRHLEREVRLAGDVRGLRESLMEDLRRERKYSPTRKVFPGFVALLSGPQLEEEIEAESEVPILLAVVNQDTIQGVRAYKEVEGAARRVLRSARVVKLEGSLYPEVVRKFKVLRYPTFIWLEPRTGRELGRFLGFRTAAALFDRTKAVAETPLLPEGRKQLAGPSQS